MKKVYITVINDLVTDQRVQRVASLLSGQGMEVSCIGRKLKNSPDIEDRGYHIHRFKLMINKGPFFYLFFNIRLLFKLLFVQDPKLFIANDLDTLPAVYLASRIRGVKLIYDSHEFFTQVPELIGRPGVQSVWKGIEAMLVPRVKHAITVSYPIAEIYRRLYGTRFRVVRNVPSYQASTRGSYDPGDGPIIIYQGSLNVGRGLELMILSMKLMEEVRLFIAGSGDIEDDLKELVLKEGLTHRVIFKGRLEPEDLLSLTSLAGLGISLEEDLGLNYRYALPNKLFDYIQSRVPVLCSYLPEMAKIVESYGIGIAIRNRDPENIAKVVRFMLEEHEAGAWDGALEKAAKDLCWEKESDLYLEVVKESGVL